MISPQLLLSPLFFFLSVSAAQSSYSSKELNAILWQLADADTPISGSPYLGHQNITTCCLKAIATAIEVVDGQLQFKPGHDNWIIFEDEDASPNLLVNYSSRGQFPCTATYNGDKRGAPVVQVDYAWLSKECPGWQISSTENLDSWLQPLSGFLVPAVVFCLSVPRRRKFEVPRLFFVLDLAGIKSYLPAALGAIVALVMVSLDTIIWLCICFAFAGPMILSGLYEAMLDYSVLEYLRLKINEKKLTLDMRCRCLMVILIGNLDLVWKPDGPNGGCIDDGNSDDGVIEPDNMVDASMDEYLHRRDNSTEVPLIVQPRGDSDDTYHHISASAYPPPPVPTGLNIIVSEAADIRPQDYAAAGQSFEQASIAPTDEPRSFCRRPSNTSTTAETDVAIDMGHETERPGDDSLASPWKHMELFLYNLRLYDDNIPERGLSPRQYAKHQNCQPGSGCRNRAHNEQPIPRTREIEKEILQVKTRLKTMLQCQYSFGSVVGAPIIFFLGGFIFTYLQSFATLGDENIAIGLSFGQWFMIIPHIAIISGLLLAGNNPNILEGVLAVNRKFRHDDIKFCGLTYGLAYPSCYKVAWLWNRGHNKKQWLNTLVATYQKREDVAYICNEDDDPDIVDLRDKIMLSLLDWIMLLTLAMVLLGLPYVLAFLTAYFTPEIGLSCRSLTLTVYFCVQIFQIILWMWAYAGPLASFSSKGSEPRPDKQPGFFSSGGWLDNHDFYRPYSLRWLRRGKQPKPRTPTALMNLLWQSRSRMLCWGCLWNVLYYFSQWITGLFGIMAAIGGTLLQLMGVYSANICLVTTPYWFKPLDQRPMVLLSVNSPEMIKQATLMWKPCAITAIVFMGTISFMGWWYQRRMRDMFTAQVERIDKDERDDTTDSRDFPDYVTPRPFLTPHPPTPAPLGMTTSYASFSSSQTVQHTPGRPTGL